MPEVSIEVAGRVYRVGCGEGEEPHLVRLAERIDQEALKLSRKMGAISEGRLMLMAALMLADKLSEAEAALAAAERRAVKAERLAESRVVPDDLFNPEREAEIAASLDALAERIEALAGRVDASV